jgi:hypothetical protein
MTKFRSGSRAAWLRLGLIAICLGYSLACSAKSTGVDEDTALQSGPCYQALVDRNVAQPTTAPNRELGAACETEHGDIERAWARVVRLWGSDSADVPDYDSYRRADDGAGSNPVWKGLALVGMLLVYALCGTPSRSATRLTAAGDGARRSAGKAIVNLAGRGLLGLVLLWLSSFSYLTLLGALAFIAIVAQRLRRPASARTASAPEGLTNGGNRFADFAADEINDLLGAAPGLIGLALLAQHDARLLAIAVGLAIVASTPAVISARRRLRARPLATTSAAALLAAGIGAFAQLDPPIAALVGSAGALVLIGPVAFALVVVASGWRRNWSVARTPLKSET